MPSPTLLKSSGLAIFKASSFSNKLFGFKVIYKFASATLKVPKYLLGSYSLSLGQLINPFFHGPFPFKDVSYQ
jgi:hypothetical protein